MVSQDAKKLVTSGKGRSAFSVRAQKMMLEIRNAFDTPS